MNLNDEEVEFNFSRLMDSIESEFSRNKYNNISRYDTYSNIYDDVINMSTFIAKKKKKEKKFTFINQFDLSHYMISMIYNDYTYYYREHEFYLFISKLEELIC